MDRKHAVQFAAAWLLFLLLASPGAALTCRITKVDLVNDPDALSVVLHADRAPWIRHRVYHNLRGVPFCLAVDLEGQLHGIRGGLRRIGSDDILSVRYGNYASSPPTVRVSVSGRKALRYSVTREDGGLVVRISVLKAASGGEVSAQRVRTTSAGSTAAHLSPTDSSAPAASARPHTQRTAPPRTEPREPTPPPASQRTQPPTAPDMVSVGPTAGTISLEAVDTDIVSLLRAVASQLKVSIVVAPDVKANVTISLRHATLTEALDAIVRLSGLDYREVNGTYYVAPKDRLKEMFPTPTVTERYLVTKADPADVYARLRAAFADLKVTVEPPKTLILEGTKDTLDKVKAVLPMLDVEPPPAPPTAPAPEVSTEVYEVRYLDLAAAKTFLSEMFPAVTATSAPSVALPPASTGDTGPTAPSASVPSPLLVLRGPKADVENALAMLKNLDVPPRQVEIEARVVDLSTSLEDQKGFTWTWQPYDIVEGVVGAPQLEDAPIVGGITPRPRQGRDFYKFGTFSRSATEIQLVIDALVRSGSGRILAEPRIRVINGSAGQIFIGDTITYVVSRDVTPTGTSINTAQIQAGVRLEVAPKILADGTVMLGLNTEVSALTGFSGGLPTTSERRDRTSIMLKDGETIAIGGLFRDEDISTLTKLPLLGDLPFFGNLFRSRNKSKRHSEVVIFLTTRISQS
ncbi:MAG: hypothetical protein ACUVRO_07915 [Armatimonadota bacterium]